MKSLSLIIISCIAVSTPAWSLPMTVTYIGAGSGTMNGKAFGLSTFTINAFGDTDNVFTRANGNHVLIHSSATIAVSGLGTFSFVTSLETFVNPTVSVAGLCREIGGDLFDSAEDPVFSSYDLRSALSPLTSSFDLFQWEPDAFGAVLTSGGTLIFDDRFTLGSMEVRVGEISVAEPGSLELFAVGISLALLMIFFRLGRRTEQPVHLVTN